MSVHHQELDISTGGDGEMHDLTEKVAALVTRAGISQGVVLIFVRDPPLA